VLQSTLEGLERQVLSNMLLSVTGLIRLALGLGSLAFIAPTAQAFFWSQILASVIETSTFAFVVVKVVPGALTQRPDKTLIWGSLRFASVNVAAAATGTLVQIADSLVISAMLPLAVFGTYSLISTMCSAMVRLCTPLITASFPRMSAHAHAGRVTELRDLFFTISQATFVLLLSAAGALVFFGGAFLELVSGKPEIGLHYAPVLALLAIAYALSGLCRPSHALLMSEGDASTALKINIIEGVLYLPAILLLTPRYGVIVPAACLIAGNLLAFVLFTASAFKRLLRGIAWPWLATSVAPQILAVTAGCLAVRLTVRGDVGLWPHLALAVAGSGLAFVLGAAASDHIRPLVASAVRRKA
jgi:O-antigen/teichoic acid export membrane protein